MVRKKRAYVPKVKGCYECSQRRIDCDRTEPSCNKCSLKGIECSGFGFKYRFREGFSSRQKKSAHRFSISNGVSPPGASPGSSEGHVQPSPRHDSALSNDYHHNCLDMSGNGFGSFFLGLDNTTALEPDLADFVNAVAHDAQNYTSSTSSYEQAFEAAPQSHTLNGTQLDLTSGSPHTCSDVSDWRDLSSIQPNGVFDVMAEYAALLDSEDFGFDNTTPSPDNTTPIDGTLLTTSDGDLTSPVKQLLLEHYSRKIAPEMVVIDGGLNGWRSIVLQTAQKDDLVMSAVLTASAFHLAGSKKSHLRTLVDPGDLYTKTIQKLEVRKELPGFDTEMNQKVVLAIVVLLVTCMINRYSDFPVMFRLLESALDTIGGEQNLMNGGEMAEFCLRQIRKMRVYAAPLISREDGIRAVVSQAKESSDCIQYYRERYPEHSPALDILEDLRSQAFDIYLGRALRSNTDTADQSSRRIEGFVETVNSFPQGSPGEHALVWPCFIAASESRQPKHRQYFANFLQKQYERNGFGNILDALSLLQIIWDCDAYPDWPSLLPGPQVFIM